MYIDWTYIYLVLPAVAFAMWASAKVNSTFRRYSDVYSQSNITGREAAQMVLQQNGVFGVGRFPESSAITTIRVPTPSVFPRPFITALLPQPSASRPMKRGMPCSMPRAILPLKCARPSCPPQILARVWLCRSFCWEFC